MCTGQAPGLNENMRGEGQTPNARLTQFGHRE